MKKGFIQWYATTVRRLFFEGINQVPLIVLSILLAILVRGVDMWVNLKISFGAQPMWITISKDLSYSENFYVAVFMLLAYLGAIGTFILSFLPSSTSSIASRWLYKMYLLFVRWTPGYWLAISSKEGMKRIFDVTLPAAQQLTAQLHCLSGDHGDSITIWSSTKKQYLEILDMPLPHFRSYHPEQDILMNSVSIEFCGCEIFLTDDYHLAKRWLKGGPRERYSIETSLVEE